MFLIERFLHISPDHGSGLTELGVLAVLVTALLLTKAARRFVSNQPQSDRSRDFRATVRSR